MTRYDDQKLFEEKLFKKKLKAKYKNLNFKGGFLQINYVYNKNLKSYEVLDVYPGSVGNWPDDVDMGKYMVDFDASPTDKNVWIEINDILISIKKEDSKKVLNLQNINDPDILPKFLGKIPRYTWLKLNFKRKTRQAKFVTKYQWHMVVNFDEYCSSTLLHFKDFFFPQKKSLYFDELPEDYFFQTNKALNKWKESLFEGYPDFNLKDYYEKNFKR